MRCPHCLVEFHPELNERCLGEDADGYWFIHQFTCPNPNCKRNIVYLVKGQPLRESISGFISCGKIEYRKLVRPKGITRPLSKFVPEEFAEDFKEACLVLEDSPKASAALSRRCLQHLLREKAGIIPGNLSDEIQQVLDAGTLPSHLSESIDAIRNIGNFSTHPIKSQSTGQIVPVEPGEAEWNLDVLEGLFDFYFVQPAITAAKKALLDAKLGDAGKPPMK